MNNYYWLKLHYELLDDYKVGTLADSLKWRFIQCLLVAGETNESGFLPQLKQFAFRIRPMSPEALQADMAHLASAGLVELRIDKNSDERWFVTNFGKRQEKISDADRMKAMRDRKRKELLEWGEDFDTDESRDGYENVTSRNTDKIRLDKDRDKNTTAVPTAKYAEIIKVWGETFPNKPQPRPSNTTLQDKTRVRMKKEHFKENWQPALIRASKSKLCRDSSWFDLGWFLKNEENYEKCLNGNYDAGPSPNGQHASKELDATRTKYKGSGVM